MPDRALRLAEAYSTRTLAQSQFSSSATIMASAVEVPWPISWCGRRMVTLLSGSITRKAVISGFRSWPSAQETLRRPFVAARTGKPMANPPAAESPQRMARRLSLGWKAMSFMALRLDLGRQRGGAMDGFPDARIGAAAAEVGEIGVDVGVCGFGVGLQEGRRAHDLAGLAVAALGHVLLQPGLLHRVAQIGRQRLDGDDLGALGGLGRQDAGALRLAVHVHRAGAALGDAAAELGPGQAQLVAQHPEQRRVVLDIELMGLAVH